MDCLIRVGAGNRDDESTKDCGNARIQGVVSVVNSSFGASLSLGLSNSRPHDSQWYARTNLDSPATQTSSWLSMANPEPQIGHRMLDVSTHWATGDVIIALPSDQNPLAEQVSQLQPTRSPVLLE